MNRFKFVSTLNSKYFFKFLNNVCVNEKKYLPVGIFLHQGATVHRDRNVLHAVILFVIGGLKAQVMIGQEQR